jgi:nitroreductase
MNLADITLLIETRRSHFPKEFNGQIADNDLISQMISNAHWAPSHKLTLPWHFIVFEPRKIDELSKKIIQIQLNSNPNVPQEKIEKINSLPSQLSHAIAICLKPSKMVPLWEEYCAVGAAVENMYLTLNTIPDFGGYWTSGNGTNTQEMKEYLELSENDEHLGFFFIGGIDQKRTHSKRNTQTVVWK